MAHARSAPRPAPTLSPAEPALGESTWSVGRQRAAWAPRGSDVVEEAGREGAWSRPCPGGRGGAGRHPWGSVGLGLAQEVRKSLESLSGPLRLIRPSSSPFLLSLQVFS